MKKTDLAGRIKSKADKNISKKKKLITLIALPLILAVVIGVTYICGGFEAIDYFLFYRHRSIDPSVVSSGSFPVTFTGGDIITVDNISSKAVVLSKKLLTCISYKGRVLYTESHSFVEPEMKTEGKYGIVFDRGSDNFLIFDAYGIVYQGSVEDGRSIITATVDSKGNIALSTKSNDSACRVYMLDKKGQTKYIWSCADNYVVSLDFGKDSEKILCGAIGALNNEVLTQIYVLDIYSDKVTSTFKVDEAACVDIMYLDKGQDKIILTCTDKRLIFDIGNDGVLGGTPARIAYRGGGVLIDSDSKGNTAVLTERYNSPDTKELTLYDKDNNTVFTCSTPSDAVALLCSEDKVYCLTEKSIITYSKNPDENNETMCDIFGEGLIELKGKIRYYSSKTIKNGF